MIDKHRLDLNSNTFPNFVGAWSMPENSVCDQIVDFFESNENLQKPGKVSSGAVNTNVKKSIDIKIEPKYLNNPGYEPFIKYFEESLYKFLWANAKLNSMLTWLENVRLIENWWPISLLKSTEWRWREIKGEEASLNKKFINKTQLKQLAAKMPNSDYKEYIEKILWFYY